MLDFGVARWRDGTSDLYALGLVAFRALTGAPAFSRAWFESLGLGVFNLPFPKASEKVASLPPAVDAWFAKACAKKPDDRFTDGATMAAALANAVGVNAPTEIADAPRSEGPTRARTAVPKSEPTPTPEPPQPTDAGLAQPTSPPTTALVEVGRVEL